MLPVWMARAGALLVLLSPLVPQARLGGEAWSPFRTAAEGVPASYWPTDPAAWLLFPVLPGLALLALLLSPGRATAVPSAVLLFLVSFACAVAASVLLSLPPGPPGGAAPSEALLLALFAAPLAASAWTFARLMSGADAAGTGALARGTTGLLLLLAGLLWADAGWAMAHVWMRLDPPPPSLLPGAAMLPAGGVLVLAGEVLGRVLPRRRAIVNPPPPAPVDLPSASR